MSQEQEEEEARIPRIWVDREESSAEEDSKEDSEEEEDWVPAAAGVPKRYKGVSPPSPPPSPPFNAITAMQDMCCR